jgi:hypothetical protein
MRSGQIRRHFAAGKPARYTVRPSIATIDAHPG